MSIEVGSIGVWTMIDSLDIQAAGEFAVELEALGYSALWIPETVGREPLTMLAYLAAKTSRLTLATGIANIYARDPITMKAIHKTMAQLAPGRFVLGLGVSHAHLVTKVRGHEYGKPLSTMRNYIDQMEEALYVGLQPEQEAPIVLAALRPKMLQLAGERTAGAHPYFVTPEHTAKARAILGPDPLLCPEQKVILQQDVEKARALGRKHMTVYLRAPNYQNSLKELGFDDSDFENGGSDRLVDAICAWGDESALRARIDAHFAAGATHVCIQPFRPDGEGGPDMQALRLLAPANR